MTIDRLSGLLRVCGRPVLTVLLVLVLTLGSVPAFAADTSYTVQPGDTLISIAARYGVTVDAIVAANNLPSRSTIYAGQVLTIPSPGSASGSSQAQPNTGRHVVGPGDTLSSIALRYGTTVDAIMRANGMTSTTIYVGQSLAMPSAGDPAPPAPTNPPSPTPSGAPTAAPAQQPQSNPSQYVVQPGDSIIRLAARFGVTQQELAAANGLDPFAHLQVGQVLTIPQRGMSESGGPQQPPAPTAAATPQPPPPPTAQPTTTPLPVAAEPSVQPGKPVEYTVQSGDNLSSIAARFNTTVEALMEMNDLDDGNFLRVGQKLVIVKGNDQNNDPPENTPTPQPTPPMGQFGPKWIDVDISDQLLVAIEGQTPVFSAKVSTGLPRHPTVEGTYRVYAKYRSAKMEGGQGADYYYIPNVPYIMYFYSGYGIHGAFWHNNFGQPMSHGCVNLPVDSAKWMYEWAPVGTPVIVHP